MKKLIALMLALVACFTMLASCGPDDESGSSEESSSAAEEGNLPEEDTSSDFEVEF